MYFLICTVYVFNSIQLSVMKRRQWKYHLLSNTPFYHPSPLPLSIAPLHYLSLSPLSTTSLYRPSPLPLSIAPLHYLSLSPSPSTLPSPTCCLPQVFILSAAPHATDQGSFNLDRRRANSPCIFMPSNWGITVDIVVQLDYHVGAGDIHCAGFLTIT